MTDADIRAKFAQCASFGLEPEAAQRAVGAIDGLLSSRDVSAQMREVRRLTQAITASRRSLPDPTRRRAPNRSRPPWPGRARRR